MTLCMGFSGLKYGFHDLPTWKNGYEIDQNHLGNLKHDFIDSQVCNSFDSLHSQ